VPTDDDALQAPMVLPPISELAEVELQEDVPEEENQDLSTFDPRYKDPFVGLLYLGSLKKTVKLYGHEFKIETPSQRARIEAGVLHKEFVNTLSAEIGWASLTVASYLQSVDGNPLPAPISTNLRDTGVSDRYDWVVDNLRQPVILALFEECLILDAAAQDALNELSRLGER
jgi:hypothetical protein